MTGKNDMKQNKFTPPNLPNKAALFLLFDTPNQVFEEQLCY